MFLRKLVIAAFAISASAAFANATVKQAQQALNDKGYDVGVVDGVMGARTQSALQKFQQAQGLSSSGSLDAQTLASLGVSGDASASASSSFSPRNDQPPAQPLTPPMTNSSNSSTGNNAAPAPTNETTSLPAPQGNPATNK